MTDGGAATSAWLALPPDAGGEVPGEFPQPDEGPDGARREGRCGHFGVSVATVAVPGVFVPMQVPIYRCALAELMILRLRTVPEGRRLAASLEARPLEGHPRLVCGPDLEAITTTTCTVD